ncbi:hypothetical protein GWK47_028694 [Chionoecetes opilio]|uniref:Uncharacterized protein n=1 Tax=Chionoecetes opilio TaxID=41210 RepID=A0A8J5D5Z5_CHIOP|nr:hypothetical protein GWK47_028694 [Chionoecetes opilio]
MALLDNPTFYTSNSDKNRSLGAKRVIWCSELTPSRKLSRVTSWCACVGADQCRFGACVEGTMRRNGDDHSLLRQWEETGNHKQEVPNTEPMDKELQSSCAGQPGWLGRRTRLERYLILAATTVLFVVVALCISLAAVIYGYQSGIFRENANMLTEGSAEEKLPIQSTPVRQGTEELVDSE